MHGTQRVEVFAIEVGSWGWGGEMLMALKIFYIKSNLTGPQKTGCLSASVTILVILIFFIFLLERTQIQSRNQFDENFVIFQNSLNST